MRAALAVCLSALLAGCGSTAPIADPPPTSPPADVGARSAAPATPTRTPAAAPAPLPELPRGGRTLFPRYRLVGYAGAPGTPAFGRLGVGDLDARAAEIERRMAPYGRDGREVMPVLELIATVALATPGEDGLYRARQSTATIRRYLAAARRVDGLLLLNIQPGRADFLDEVRAHERWLREPDVGLALDPEWAVGPGSRPGEVYGRTSGAELDGVGRHVAAIVREHRLPQKVVVFHQVAPSVVPSLRGLRQRPEVVWVRSVDGIGPRADKEATWRRVTARQPRWVHGGFKLFYEEDRRTGALMTPGQVLRLRPLPEYVLYE